MQARAEADLRLTSRRARGSTASSREAARLRREYRGAHRFSAGTVLRVPDRGSSRSLAIDTGIVKRIDPAQWSWLEGALDRAKGKLTMAVLGHPLYAKSFDMALGNQAFAQLKRLLLDRGVTIVMAGDTHDFEYYAEPPRRRSPAVHHFVNGGGGAYLSLGTALDWPDKPPTSRMGVLSEPRSRREEDRGATPWWKRPAWWWTRRLPRLAVLVRISFGAVRLQHRALLSELRRNPRRTVGQPGPGAALRGQRAVAMARSIPFSDDRRRQQRSRQSR